MSVMEIVAFIPIIVGLWLLSFLVRRPWIRKRHPERRCVSRLVGVIGFVILLFGVLLVLAGITKGENPAEIRADVIAGSVLLLIAILLLWTFFIVYVEAGPDAFRSRGMLGRTRTIRYADIARISYIGSGGPDGTNISRTSQTRLRARDGTTITAGNGLFDWEHYRAWQERTGQQAPEE
ncbi:MULTISPECIES: hypothetical protein [unclassified Brachybacterium]|uniref:hypothetical protein n=1 Tax=unclassified Brachybacterium TaxID=2623841 RepID=UPI00361F8B2C